MQELSANCAISTTRVLLSAAIIAAMGGVAHAVEQPEGDVQIGSWKFSSETDAMSDRRRASVVVHSGRSVFAFQCDAAGPGSIYPIFVASQFLGGEGAGYGRRSIWLRFDADQPIEADWVYKDIIAFVPNDHRQALRLMARAATAQKLAVRALTYDSRFVDEVFQLSGTASAIEKLAKACGDDAGAGAR